MLFRSVLATRSRLEMEARVAGSRKRWSISVAFFSPQRRRGAEISAEKTRRLEYWFALARPWLGVVIHYSPDAVFQDRDIEIDEQPDLLVGGLQVCQ